MFGRVNQKILGAFLAGTAMVAGAYIYSTLKINKLSQPAAAIEATPPARVAIPVSDKDSNGVEDWRDTFFTTKAVINDTSTSTYEFPTTVTGKLSIQLLQDFINSKYYAPIAKNKEQVLEDTIDTLNKETAQKLFDTRDVTIMGTWNDGDIKNFANAIGSTARNNSSIQSDHELNIARDALVNGKTERLKELEPIVKAYKNIVNDSLATPVPSIFLKEHLDLINSYSAIQEDIAALAIVETDPMVTFMRFKRYQEDAMALNISLQNMYSALAPYSQLFTADDPAIFFATFNPNNSRP
ncbi:MAG: hypothetical protein RLZZ480_493 [Candidatus Parcubacteria bacterium]|jgi:hypothetical protein